MSHFNDEESRNIMINLPSFSVVIPVSLVIIIVIDILISLRLFVLQRSHTNNVLCPDSDSDRIYLRI